MNIDEQETIRRIECVTMEDIERILPVCLNQDDASTALVGRLKKQTNALRELLR